MSLLDVSLTAVDGTNWRLAYMDSSGGYLASMASGSASIASATLNHDLCPGQVQFSVYLNNAFINFPASEFQKFKAFWKASRVSRVA